jgi:hypothetical protein
MVKINNNIEVSKYIETFIEPSIANQTNPVFFKKTIETVNEYLFFI